ncbi:MAG: glycosyltransferase family 4 protein [Candidatus Methylarchaceae archaeon HK01M]|nr:glycosyltransferase family 4 protein [Candidatus Methylarchaceae archaeon HK01M]
MKILILVGYTYPVVGGTELASFNIAKHLAQHGHEVTLVARYSAGFRSGIITQIGEMKPYEELYDGKLKIHRVKIMPTMGGRFLSQTLRAFLLSWHKPPEVVLGFTLMPTCFSAIIVKYLLMIARLRRVPVIAWGRGSDVFVTPSRKGLIGFLIRNLLKFVFQADLILAQTPAMLETLVKMGCKKGKIKILGNGIDLSSYSEFRTKLNNKTVIYVGGARPAKGLLYLISAVNKIKNVNLVVVGGWGEQEYAARALAESNTKFIETVPNDSIPCFLKEASCFILPSISEGFSNSLLEAMAVGLPVIATNVGGNPYVLGDAGILVSPKDDEALRKAIVKLFGDRKLLEEFSKHSLERVKLFSWDAIIDRLENIMQEVKK